jgi:tRNA pseudouridine55 synthase
MPNVPVRTERAPRQELHGVLLLDKALGWSSNDALQKARGILRAKKAGHTGTLDPLATGLLPLCFGAATKFSQAALDADKRYTATVHLGVRRVGGDGEGEVIEERPVPPLDEATLFATLAGFVGRLSQCPPMHSALKHQGRALYDYARQGIEVERAPREVQVHSITMLSWGSPMLTIDVHCSKGTYIRTLAEDIGTALGCGAHLAALRRTGSGGLRVDQAISLQALEALSLEEQRARLLPPDVLLQAEPPVRLGEEDAARFLCGLRRRTALADAPRVRVYGPPVPGTVREAFFGSAHIRAGELIPDRLLSPQEVQALSH